MIGFLGNVIAHFFNWQDKIEEEKKKHALLSILAGLYPGMDLDQQTERMEILYYTLQQDFFELK